MAKRRKGAMASAWLGSCLLFSSCTVEDLFETGTVIPVDAKVVSGLKAALRVGIDSSAASASRANGYLANQAIRVLLPAEASQALDAAGQAAALVKPFKDKLAFIQTLVSLTPGTDKNSFAANLNASATLLADLDALEGLGDSLVKYMNRAAEAAAPRSVPVFTEAIANLTINDGLSLLNSSDSTAATAFLGAKTFTPLTAAYTPIVDSTLALLPLTEYWGDFRSGYNAALAKYESLLAFQASWNANAAVSSIPDLQVTALKKLDYAPIVTESLGAWTTEKALGGLFVLVGGEEREIRRDPLGYVKGLSADISGLLREVFGDIMKMPEG